MVAKKELTFRGRPAKITSPYKGRWNLSYKAKNGKWLKYETSSSKRWLQAIVKDNP
jgi:hypothetical protein